MSGRTDDVLSFGARVKPGEVEFRLHAAADRVELCLFDERGLSEYRRVDLANDGDSVWSTTVQGVGVGARYGYRVHGAYDAGGGARCNPAKLLVDPYALEVCGDARWHPWLEASDGGDRPSTIDSASVAPKCVVVDRFFDWRGDVAPGVAWSDTVIYECHVKGLTMAHPEVPAALRGTYLGLASEPVLAHLEALGITAVELLPVHQPFHERHLVERGLANYWGYAPLAYFAPDNRYASTAGPGAVVEFKEMVRRLHEAGIEVLLDVVYNHTGEGPDPGPLLSLRGLDNPTYYWMEPNGDGRYVDFSGCGNTLAAHDRVVSTMIVESLRYWVTDMHVDGFRFDLAATLGRDADGAFAGQNLLEALADDPVLRGTKLIAEPYDLGPDGYRLGRFPGRWREWNPEYRDTVRRYWKQDFGQLGDFATRIAGSSDIFGERAPDAGIHFVACHDGFTLHDLVRYERKHNDANGEENRDGHDHGFSRNWGHEGPTDDARIEGVRDRVSRAMLATVLLSRGVPMLQHGDELGRTQRGNNNGYCQDNPTTWVRWPATGERCAMLDLARRLLTLRRERPELRRDAFYSDDEVTWRRADGEPMSEHDWTPPGRRDVGLQVHGDTALFIVFNAGARERRYELPPLEHGRGWSLTVDTATEIVAERPIAETVLRVAPHSVVVLVETAARG